jgi:hypothetical protein
MDSPVLLLLEQLNDMGCVLLLYVDDKVLVGWNGFGKDESPTSKANSYNLGPLEMMPVIS